VGRVARGFKRRLAEAQLAISRGASPINAAGMRRAVSGPNTRGRVARRTATSRAGHGRCPRHAAPATPYDALGEAPLMPSLGVADGMVILSPALMLLAFLICGLAARSAAVVTPKRLAILVIVSPETTV